MQWTPAACAVALLCIDFVAGQQVNGTFTLVRGNGTCTPVAAVVRSPVEDDCMRATVSDVLSNMAPTIRYVDASTDGTEEIEVAIGSLVVQGGITGVDLTYLCPPDGYNGFSVAAGSFCEVTNDTQLWATFTDFETRMLKSIRVILSNSFPDPATLMADEPPFGSALFHFPDGLDLANATDDSELAFCEIGSGVVECPTLPVNSGLNTKLTFRAFGYFGTDLLGDTVIPGYWNQDDEQQLLSGITSPSNAGGLQDFYFNGSGFFLHAYAGSGPDSCQWFDFCDYACEVYNYDARFFDDLGTWNVTWKLDQEKFGVQYSRENPRTVRAYIGNAIDAAGIFPAVMYTNVEQTAYLGLDKIGSADATKQPGYAFYWYTNFTLGQPPQEVLIPPDICTNMAGATTLSPTTAGSESTMPTTEPNAEPAAAPTSSAMQYSWSKISFVGAILFLML